MGLAKDCKTLGFLGVRSVASLWGLLGKVAAPET